MSKSSKSSHSGSFAYFLGFLGAAVFYIKTAGSFLAGVIGFLKALIWPAFLVYEAFSYFAGVEAVSAF